MAERSNRGPIIIAAAILIAAVIVVVAMNVMNRNARCQELQDRWNDNFSEDFLAANSAQVEAEELGCGWVAEDEEQVVKPALGPVKPGGGSSA